MSTVDKNRDVAQFGSAPVLGTGGRRFESCHPEFLLRASKWFFLYFQTGLKSERNAFFVGIKIVLSG